MPTPPASSDALTLGGTADRATAAQHDLAGQAAGVEHSGEAEVVAEVLGVDESVLPSSGVSEAPLTFGPPFVLTSPS